MIKVILAKFRLNLLLRTLKKKFAMPRAIELGKIGPYFVVNIIDHKISDTEFLVGNVSTGMSRTSEIAWLKAFSEWIERNAFLKNKIQTPDRFTRESDGCAAYPKILLRAKTAKENARTNALDEAIERYVWGEWWDKKSAAKIETLDVNSEYCSMLKSLGEDKVIPQALHIIRPDFDSYPNKKVLILFVAIKDGGFISGGACGESDRYEEIFERAFVELLRHYLGYCRMLNGKSKPISFYDRRIYFFASGAGNNLVWERINSKSQEIVNISNIKYDSVLEHDLQQISTVHHIQFENPPYFLEGPLERLCI